MLRALLAVTAALLTPVVFCVAAPVLLCLAAVGALLLPLSAALLIAAGAAPERRPPTQPRARRGVRAPLPYRIHGGRRRPPTHDVVWN